MKSDERPEKPLSDEQEEHVLREVRLARHQGYDEIRIYFYNDKVGTMPLKQGEKSVR